jgi:hypothetical protein
MGGKGGLGVSVVRSVLSDLLLTDLFLNVLKYI